MSLHEVVSLVRSDPRRLGLPHSYASVSAFFIGVEASGGFSEGMTGFTQWLARQLSGPDNWPWEKLVVKHALGEARASRLVAKPITAAEDDACLNSLYELLLGFDEERAQSE